MKRPHAGWNGKKFGPRKDAGNGEESLKWGNRAEEVLRLGNRILDASPDYISFVGRDYVYRYVNKTYEEVHGIPSGRIAGMHVAELLGRDIFEKQVKPHFDRCLAGEEVQYESWFTFERTGRRYMFVRYLPLMNKEGTIDGLAVFSQDITERKLAESRMRESEDQFQSIFEHAVDGIMIADIEQKRNIEANRAICDMLGYARDEILGSSIESLHPKEDLPRILDLFERQARGEISLAPDIPMVRKDGSVIFADVNSVRQVIDGKPCVLGVFRDITERKKMEASLGAREKQLAESQRIGHIGSWEHNLTTGKVVWSDELFRLLGLDPEKDSPDFKMFFDMVHPDDRPALKQAIDETIKTGKHFGIDYRVILRDGMTRVLHAQAELLRDAAGRQVVLSGTAQDFTERKKAESALEESEKRLRTLIDAIPDAVIFKDKTGRHMIANKANEELFGLSQEMLIGKMVEDILPPELAATCKRNDEEALKNKKTVRDEEHSTDKNGNEQILDTIRVPLYDDNGNAMGLVGIIRDVTERKLSEEKIRQSEQFIRNILDTVDEGFIVIDRDYRIVTANKAYCAQVGGTCDGIIGRHCYEISHGTHRPCYEDGEECAVRQTFATGEPHAALHRHEDQEGRLLYVETKGFPIKDAAGNVASVIETINNITEKHLLEEERLKTQKLESIGTLAGGIAHDFNNLLQGIFGYISMAKLTFDRKDKALAMLEQAENALHQSVNLTTQLLTFSRGGKPVKRLIDLRPVIENAARFTLSGSRSDFRMDVGEGLWQAEADEGQIGQVIQNIVLNADQSMPLGGSVTITAKNAAEGDASLPPGLARGNYIMISIQDTGVGIPEQYIGKIFDPYFTTKEKGSGLGLATSYSIVRNHGGMIDVKTMPGDGSTFTIYLPAIVGEGRAASAIRSAGQPPARTARVLVMDDEEIIRNLSVEILNTLGHSVDVAKHGQEALEKYQRAMTAGKPFDIVILDLTVRGGMGGSETMQKIREIDPAVKAIVSSGYSDDTAIASYLSRGFKAYLKKPYDIDQLRDVLNSLLL